MQEHKSKILKSFPIQGSVALLGDCKIFFFHKIRYNMIIVSGAILHQHYTGQWMEESSKTHPLQKLLQKSKN